MVLKSVRTFEKLEKVKNTKGERNSCARPKVLTAAQLSSRVVAGWTPAPTTVARWSATAPPLHGAPTCGTTCVATHRASVVLSLHLCMGPLASLTSRVGHVQAVGRCHTNPTSQASVVDLPTSPVTNLRRVRRSMDHSWRLDQPSW